MLRHTACVKSHQNTDLSEDKKASVWGFLILQLTIKDEHCLHDFKDIYISLSRQYRLSC